MPKKTGRPTVYTEKIATSICARIMDGESLRSICRDAKMPARSSVHKWLAENEAFSDRYARACDIRADEVFDEMFEIADDGSNDWMERKGSDGQPLGWQLNGEHVQRSKLRIDARKWALSKMMPKKYGDKIQQEHTSPDGSMSPKFDASKLSDAALKELMDARRTGAEPK